jgi:hypothetical protein
MKIWVGHETCMVKLGNAFNILVEKSEGKKSLGTHRLRWENNIKMDLKEISIRMWM